MPQKLTIFCLRHHESHRNFWYIMVGIPPQVFVPGMRAETSRQCSQFQFQFNPKMCLTEKKKYVVVRVT